MVSSRSAASSAVRSYRSGAGNGALSSSDNGWDQSGGARGRNSASWGQSSRSLGNASPAQRQARGGATSDGGWTPPGPSSQGGGGWNGWVRGGTGRYTAGRGAMGPPAGRSNWDRLLQAHRGLSKSEANASSWVPRKTSAVGGSGWGTADTSWTNSSHKKRTWSGWDSGQESHGVGRNSWEEAPGSKTGRRVATLWEQPRGDFHRGDAGRDGSKQVGSSWDSRTTKEATPASAGGSWDKSLNQPTESETGWTSTEPPDSPGFWGTNASSNKGKDGVQNWDQPSSFSPLQSGWGVSQSDNLDSSVSRKREPNRGESTNNISQAQESRGRVHAAGSRDTVSSGKKFKERIVRSGWDEQNGVEMQRADRRCSGWDQQVHVALPGALDRRAGRGCRKSWDYPPAYSPAIRSGRNRALREAPVVTSARKDRGGSWVKPKQPSESDSGWTSMEAPDSPGVWGASGRSKKGKDGVGDGDLPSSFSPSEIGWDVSESNNWDSSDCRKRELNRGASTHNTSHAQESSGWGHSTSSRQKSKEKMVWSGWDEQSSVERQRTDMRHSDWEQQVRLAPLHDDWDHTAGRGGRSNWDYPVSQSAGNSTLQEAPVNTSPKNIAGGSWDTPSEKPNESENGWTLTEAPVSPGAWGTSAPSNEGRDGNWALPSSFSPAEVGWV